MQFKQKITPFLWFDGTALEAAEFYTRIFENSKVTGSMAGPDGKPMTVTFELAGQQFMALNGGPNFKFNEAISLMVGCDTQEEIDRLWESLSADGGAPIECGWLKDKYGLFWQIIPNMLGPLLSGGDPERAARALQAVWTMKKLDIAAIQRAADGKQPG